MNTPKPRLSLLGLAFGILLALLLVPQTRWLVRLQLLTALHLYHPLPCDAYTVTPASDARLRNAVAAHHADDFQVQYASAVSSGGTQTLPRLRALTRRFPNSPFLSANILRYESRAPLSRRTEGYELAEEPVPSSAAHAPSASPEALAAYDAEAAAGERLDPQNAYFPFMRAYGFFAAHRDAEALAAVRRAGADPVWNEYLTENVEAQWRLHEAAFGDPGALPQSVIYASELLPQYSCLRETSRLVTYQAVLKEQAGQWEDGLTLRDAVRRCGELMRVQSTTLVGSLVGIAISHLSEIRPGGGPLPRATGTPPAQMARLRLDAYCAYVTKIGHPEAARRARDEEAAGRSVQALTGTDASGFDITKPILRLISWWMAGIALLLNIGWLLILGLAVAGRARLAFAPKPPIGRVAAASQITGALGLWLLVFLFVILVSNFSFSVSDPRALVWRVSLGLGGAFGFVVWYVARALRRLTPDLRWAILRTALLLPVLAGILYGLYWLAEWVASPLAGLPQGYRALLGSDSNSDAEQAAQSQTLQLCAAASLAVPLLFGVILSLTALARRAPVSQAVTSGFQKLAFPIACLLLVVYGGGLIGTARQEYRVSQVNRQYVAEGGRYFAARIGQAWPGLVQ